MKKWWCEWCSPASVYSFCNSEVLFSLLFKLVWIMDHTAALIKRVKTWQNYFPVFIVMITDILYNL